MLDYHVHTNIGDGVNTLEENIEFAIEKGLTEIGISDHFGLYPENGDEVFGEGRNWGKDDLEIRLKNISPFSIRGSLCKYFEDINKAKEKYQDKIIVKSAVEMDLYESNLDLTYNVVMSYKPDYIIGSIHALDKIGFQDEKTFYKATPADYIHYIEVMTDCVRKGKMNIVGHINLYKRFAKIGEENRFYPYYDSLIEACRDTGTAIEFNMGQFTDNYDKSLYFFKKCEKEEVPLIVTSDAHVKESIGADFNIAFELLKEAGVIWTATFDNCKMNKKRIDYSKYSS